MKVYRATYGKKFVAGRVPTGVEHGVVALDGCFPEELVPLVGQVHDLRSEEWDTHPLFPQPAVVVQWAEGWNLVVCATGLLHADDSRRYFTQREFFAFRSDDPCDVLGLTLSRTELTPVDEQWSRKDVACQRIDAPLSRHWRTWFGEVADALARDGTWSVRLDPAARSEFLADALAIWRLAKLEYRPRFCIWFGAHPKGAPHPTMGIRVDAHEGLSFANPEPAGSECLSTVAMAGTSVAPPTHPEGPQQTARRSWAANTTAALWISAACLACGAAGVAVAYGPFAARESALGLHSEWEPRTFSELSILGPSGGTAALGFGSAQSLGTSTFIQIGVVEPSGDSVFLLDAELRHGRGKGNLVDARGGISANREVEVRLDEVRGRLECIDKNGHPVLVLAFGRLIAREAGTLAFDQGEAENAFEVIERDAGRDASAEGRLGPAVKEPRTKDSLE